MLSKRGGEPGKDPGQALCRSGQYYQERAWYTTLVSRLARGRLVGDLGEKTEMVFLKLRSHMSVQNAETLGAKHWVGLCIKMRTQEYSMTNDKKYCTQKIYW